jgi:hypothetical protein
MRWLGSLQKRARKMGSVGSFETHEPLRADPSRFELEPVHEPRAYFPALLALTNFLWRFGTFLHGNRMIY